MVGLPVVPDGAGRVSVRGSPSMAELPYNDALEVRTGESRATQHW